MDYSEEVYYLRQALTLAKIRKGNCAPNPSVGAVVVKEGQILATGYHWGSGYPHAEVEALASLTHKAIGATLYVTLEPCCHWGKTPPCTSLIIEHHIARVVYGYADPNPQVSGKGRRILTEAGIVCEHLSLPEITAFYQSYQYWQATSQPYVIAKLAMSLDSKIAAANYQPVQITGSEAQLFTHQQRKQADAIFTTARTITADNPWLNVRLPEQAIQYKPLYILDRELAVSLNANIFQSTAKITVFHAEPQPVKKIASFTAKGINCVAINPWDKQQTLTEILTYIGHEGIHELWVEAGGQCFTSLLTHNLLQKAYIYIAPILLGLHAVSAFSTQENLLAKANKISWQILGNDMMAELAF